MEPLISLLDEKLGSVQEGVVKALGASRDPRAVDALIAVVEDPGFRELRAIAAEQLGAIGDPQAIQPLIALWNSDFNLGYRAEGALEKIGAPAVEPLSRSVLGQKQIIVGGRYIGGDQQLAVEPLIGALRQGNPRVQACAAESLGSIRDARAVEPLIAALRSADLEVQVSAADALGQIGDRRAAQPLIAALANHDPKLRRSVFWALSEIPDPKIIKPLTRVASDAGFRSLGLNYQTLCENLGARAIPLLAAAIKTRTHSSEVKRRNVWVNSTIRVLCRS